MRKPIGPANRVERDHVGDAKALLILAIATAMVILCGVMLWASPVRAELTGITKAHAPNACELHRYVNMEYRVYYHARAGCKHLYAGDPVAESDCWNRMNEKVQPYEELVDLLRLNCLDYARLLEIDNWSRTSAQAQEMCSAPR